MSPLIIPRPFKSTIVASSYYNTIVGDTPFAYWRLGESAASTVMVNEMSPTNSQGTYYNTPTLATVGAISNDTDTAVEFDGISQYAASDLNESLITTGDFSFEAWMMPDVGGGAIQIARGDDTATGGSGWSVILSLSTINAGFSVVVTSGGALQFSNNVSGTYNSLAYYHLVGTYVEGSGIRVYINGVDAGFVAVSRTGLRISSTGYIFGRTNGAYRKGTIDEVSIYTKALSATQVLNHYNAGIGV